MFLIRNAHLVQNILQSKDNLIFFSLEPLHACLCENPSFGRSNFVFHVVLIERGKIRVCSFIYLF